MTRKPVEESIGRRDDQAIVRPGAVLAIRFAHKFAGVIGFQILHHGNSAGSFDVLLGNTAQFPPYGLSTAPTAAAPRSPYRHLELCGIAFGIFPWG